MYNNNRLNNIFILYFIHLIYLRKQYYFYYNYTVISVYINVQHKNFERKIIK